MAKTAGMWLANAPESDESKDIHREFIIKGRRRVNSFLRWLWTHEESVVPAGHYLSVSGFHEEEITKG